MTNTFDYKKYKGIQKTQLKSTNSRSMLIVESTLLSWFDLFDLFFSFEYFYKIQEVVFLVFLYPLISLNQNVICHWGWFELWTQYPGSVVPLAMFFPALGHFQFCKKAVGVSCRFFPLPIVGCCITRIYRVGKPRLLSTSVHCWPQLPPAPPARPASSALSSQPLLLGPPSRACLTVRFTITEVRIELGLRAV